MCPYRVCFSLLWRFSSDHGEVCFFFPSVWILQIIGRSDSSWRPVMKYLLTEVLHCQRGSFIFNLNSSLIQDFDKCKFTFYEKKATVTRLDIEIFQFMFHCQRQVIRRFFLGFPREWRLFQYSLRMKPWRRVLISSVDDLVFCWVLSRHTLFPPLYFFGTRWRVVSFFDRPVGFKFVVFWLIYETFQWSLFIGPHRPLNCEVFFSFSGFYWGKGKMDWNSRNAFRLVVFILGVLVLCSGCVQLVLRRLLLRNNKSIGLMTIRRRFYKVMGDFGNLDRSSSPLESSKIRCLSLESMAVPGD